MCLIYGNPTRAEHPFRFGAATHNIYIYIYIHICTDNDNNILNRMVLHIDNTIPSNEVVGSRRR